MKDITKDAETEELTNIFSIDKAKVQDHLGNIIRGTVEDTLNSMLDAEADQLCNATRYERTPHRQDTRAGSYNRKLQTRAGEVNLKVPKLRKLPFETAIIERYRRRGNICRRSPCGDVPGRSLSKDVLKILPRHCGELGSAPPR